jgi:hypothetical protein
MKLKIFFHVDSLYYIPQFQPVYDELTLRGIEVKYIIQAKSEDKDLIESIINKTPSLSFIVANGIEILRYYAAEKPSWIIFGNAFKPLDLLPRQTRIALLYHGIGIKSVYYSKELSVFDLRFTEGPFRQKQLEGMFPESRFLQTGFAKLDPLAPCNKPYKHAFNLSENRLDPTKRTLLYTPTFYPSSIERMPKEWPKTLFDFNLIIKPHLITYTHNKYKNQRRIINYWSNFENVHIAPCESISSLPYMEIADLLISEASSTLFEFAALNKPVLWLDFLKLRWSYRGILNFRLMNRMDASINSYRNIADHISKPNELEQGIRGALKNPFSREEYRLKATKDLIGDFDGKASCRVADFLTLNPVEAFSKPQRL